VFRLLLGRILAAAVGEGETDDGEPNAHVVTVQVGANDGKQNDPFHMALVLGKDITRRAFVALIITSTPWCVCVGGGGGGGGGVGRDNG
jgi:hypothetical protein